MGYSRVTQPCAIPQLLRLPQSGLARAWAWLAQSRSHRVWCLLLGLWVINAFDLAFTLMSHREGLLQEANPLAAAVLAQGSLAVCCYKVVLVIIGSSILIRYRRNWLAECTALTVLTVYVFVAMQWKTCYEVYELTHTGAISNADLYRLGALADDPARF